jgi:hypothetical protein
MSNDLANVLTKRGHAYVVGGQNNREFSFARYRIQEGFTAPVKSLCVPIPKKLQISGTEAKENMMTQLRPFFRLNVFTEKDVKVVVPLESRESDIPKNAIYISFENSVSDEVIAAVRAMVNNVKWTKEGKTTDAYMICHFTKDTRKEPANKWQTVRK